MFYPSKTERSVVVIIIIGRIHVVIMVVGNGVIVDVVVGVVISNHIGKRELIPLNPSSTLIEFVAVETILFYLQLKSVLANNVVVTAVAQVIGRDIVVVVVGSILWTFQTE